MASRLRKTRRLRGSRTHGWGQIGQHRASGHKGGLGYSGMHKHNFSSLIKYDPDHFGHDSTHPPHPIITKKWASIRDLDDLFARIGTTESGKKSIDLTSNGYDKLLGGGSTDKPYTIKVERATASAIEKVKQAGGEVLVANG